MEREKIQYLLFCNQMFGILICKTFSLLLPRMLCVNLVEIGRVVLKTKIFPFCQYIFPISFLVFISPWKWVWLFIWKKTWNEFPSPKNALCQVWLKLAQWFWRRFQNFVNVFSLFRNYLHLWKGVALHLKKLESLLAKDALCQAIRKAHMSFESSSELKSTPIWPLTLHVIFLKSSILKMEKFLGVKFYSNVQKVCTLIFGIFYRRF